MALLLYARLVFAGQLSYSQASVRGSGSSSEEPMFSSSSQSIIQTMSLVFISQPCAESCTKPPGDGKGEEGGELAFSGLIFCRRRNHGIVTSLNEHIMECPQVHLSPPIVIRLNYANSLAASSSEGQQADILNEGVDAHYDG